MRKSPAGSIASLPEAAREAFFEGLSENALAAMPWLWELWALPDHQLAPEGDWRVWVIMGGRGAGKTRAGAEWVRAQVEGPTPLASGRCRRVCLLGETIDQVRAVMVEGDSGLLAVTPPDRRPVVNLSHGKLVWPNGAEAMMASAANPEALRGPQFDCAWSDELAKWWRCREAWEMLQFCLRLGSDPRQIVTTTPRDNDVLVEVLGTAGTVVTHAPTRANRANLAPGFVEALEARYGRTALGRQELGGELIRDRAGALWSRALIEAGRVAEAPELDRVVVAVDPPVSSGADADECGIVVAGLRRGVRSGEARAYVLADLSVRGLSPAGWAGVVAAAYDAHGADRVVAEVNQGGEMVESVLRQVAPALSYRPVRARHGKRLRAEPVAALYEQGRVHHLGAFRELEDQMTSFTAAASGGSRSPDRLDALVWAITDLVLAAEAGSPRVRAL
ncbi:terminase family protein [Limibaculum sp. FT325]|nr:terminase family protein [Limibaculum sediminis]MCL5775593.1 terminase family protein [Limibaculum sediminis]